MLTILITKLHFEKIIKIKNNREVVILLSLLLGKLELCTTCVLNSKRSIPT